MAEILGFENMEQLKMWAHGNPKIWGNVYGYWMFSRVRAFESEINTHGAKRVSDIINHLEDVQVRLPK